MNLLDRLFGSQLVEPLFAGESPAKPLREIYIAILAASITPPYGMHLQGGGTFNRRNIRDNAFKRMDAQSANNSENGIYFENDVRWGTVLIASNVMGIGTDLDKGISHVNSANGNIKIFNNLRSDGQFFQAKNRDGFHDQELTTGVEAVMFNA